MRRAFAWVQDGWDVMAGLKRAPERISTLPSQLKAPPKHVDEFYRSPVWRALVRDIRRERGAFCEICGSRRGLVADHKHEIKDGGARLDPNNIELLCAPHHNSKTAAARARRNQSRD